MTEFEDLPEDCIISILSRTTPLDAARLSLVSKTFRSAADSDAVWNEFLPIDSQLMDSIPSINVTLTNNPAKKAFYMALSLYPVFFDDCRKTFHLDIKSGKKCYLLGAKSLNIDRDWQWQWTYMPESRFFKIPEARNVDRLKVRGMINTIDLSPNTYYAVYLVFMMINSWGFRNSTMKLSIGVKGGYNITRKVYLDQNEEDNSLHKVGRWPPPSLRSDGWLEIEMGEFFNSDIENEEIYMSIKESIGDSKSGFYLEGIEVRPKEY